MGDLLFHEGSLLSHFISKDSNEKHYFCFWVDVSSEVNRWLVCEISIENLKLFFQHKKTLRDLVLDNQEVVFADLDDSINQKLIMLVKIDDIPEDYLSTEESYYEEEMFEDYTQELIQSLNISNNG